MPVPRIRCRGDISPIASVVNSLFGPWARLRPVRTAYRPSASPSVSSPAAMASADELPMSTTALDVRAYSRRDPVLLLSGIVAATLAITTLGLILIHIGDRYAMNA